MELNETMRTAGAMRHFLADPVDDETLYRILDAARFAPSGANRQGWHVIVVRDPTLLHQLQELYLRTWRPLRQARGAQLPADQSGHQPGSEAANDYAESLDQLPVHLVVLVERRALVTPFPAINESSFAGGSSIYPFVQNLMLAIRAEGLGSSLTMLLNNEEPDVARLLDVPDDFALAAHLGVGWPANPHPTRLQRRPVEAFTTHDRFGGEALMRGSTPQSPSTLIPVLTD